MNTIRPGHKETGVQEVYIGPYNGNTLQYLSDIPEGAVGFVYKITNELDGRIYIGKKQFYSNTRVKIGVKEKKLTKTRKIYKTIIKESNWKEYNSSCEELKKDINDLGISNFSKVIIEICYSKADLNYKEV